MDINKRLKALSALNAKSFACDVEHSVRKSEIFKNALIIICTTAASMAKQLDIDLDVTLYILALGLNDKAIGFYERTEE